MKRVSLAIAPLLIVAGCAMPEVPPAPASIAAVDGIGASGIPPTAVGEFRLAPGLAHGLDTGVGIRGGVIKPAGGTFSHYLRDTLQAQLTAAGRFDAKAPLSISGEITRSSASSGVGENSGLGILGATFVVKRGDAEVFHKEFAAEAHWNSSFIGAVAFPEAEQGYMGLYTDILVQLFRDPDFRKAVRQSGL